MAKSQTSAPVVLQLAALPREQIGPFLLLGLDKTADKALIEASWAQRLIWARKNQITTPLEDINWARESLNDMDKRIAADAGSLNVDTTEGMLRRLRDRYGTSVGCRPLDVEKSLVDYTPAIPVPNMEEVRRQIPLGEVPLEIPALAKILEQFCRQPLDPWDEAMGKGLSGNNNP